MIADIDKAIERVRLTGKYPSILGQLGTSTLPNWPFFLELLFVDEFIQYGRYPEYEAHINPSNDKTVDFVCDQESVDSSLKCNFEGY